MGNRTASDGVSTLFRTVPGLQAIASYKRQWLAKDIVAGVVLTTLLVPQGMAYAELAGLPLITGLERPAIEAGGVSLQVEARTRK